jgi:hypothetical protein
MITSFWDVVEYNLVIPYALVIIAARCIDIEVDERSYI